MSAQSIAGSSRRSSKHESEDAVVVKAIEFTAWAKKHIRLIIAGAVVAAIVIGGLLYWRVAEQNRLDQAASEFVLLQQTAATGNLQLAARDMEQFIGRYDGTVYAEEARIALGQLYLQQDSAAQAVELLSGAANRVGSSPLGPQAAMLLAAAQQATGDHAAAIATYLRIAEDAELTFRRVAALEAAAQLHSRLGDHAAAADLYQRLADMAGEGTAEEQLYRMRLAEEEAKIGS